MKTQEVRTESIAKTLPLEKVLVPVDFSLAPANIARTGKVIGIPAANMAERLSWHPFFVGFAPKLRQSLAACATIVQFEKGETIFREGEIADGFYLVETGRVELYSNGEQNNPLFCWSWMFPPHLWTFTARAASPTTAIFLSGPRLRECCERDHSLGYELFKRMTFLMHETIRAEWEKTRALVR